MEQCKSEHWGFKREYAKEKLRKNMGPKESKEGIEKKTLEARF
jgi:hypothetical protein